MAQTNGGVERVHAPRMLVAGGDLRQLAAARRLSECYPVTLLGFDRCKASLFPDCTAAESVGSLSRDAEILLLPMPVCSEGETIFSPYSKHEIRLSSVLSSVRKGGVILGGRMSQQIREQLEALGFRTGDYAKEEAFCVRNAVPTAEGTLMLAMQALPVTLHGLRCLILGAGRLSRALQTRLSLLGAEVTVAARRCSDLAWRGGEEGKPLPHNQKRKPSQSIGKASVSYLSCLRVLQQTG